MTWAQLMEANEAFDELLDLKEKAIKEEGEKTKSEVRKIRASKKLRYSKR